MGRSLVIAPRILLAVAALGLATFAGAQVIPPPLLSMGATPIAPGGLSTVAFTITNPNSFAVQYDFDIPMPYPTVYAPGTLPDPAFTGSGCGNGNWSLSSSATSGSIVVSGNYGSCTYTFIASSSVLGMHTITGSTTAPLDTASASAGLRVYYAPTATVSFSPASILGNQSTTLVLTITNTDPVDDLDSVFGAIDLGPLTGYAMGAAGNPPGCLSGSFDGPLYFETYDFVTQTPTAIPAGGSCSLEVTLNNAPPWVPPAPPPPSLPAGSYVVPVPPAPEVVGMLGGGDVSLPVTFPVAAGTLLVSGISVSPGTIAFASQSVGSTSAPQAVTVTNVGSTALAITGVAVGGDFAATSDCTALSPLAPYAACSIAVSFSPLVAGDRAGQVTLSSDDPTNPSSVVTLAGVGVAAGPPTLSVTPARIVFPTIVAGGASAPQAVTVTNTGSIPAAILQVAVAGAGFSATHDCGTALAPLATCSISLVFSPTEVAAYAASLGVVSDAAGGPHRVDLFGQGAPMPQGQLSSSPPSLAFGDQVVGTSSAPRSFLVTNVGDASALITSIAVTGDFTASGSCPSLASGASCLFEATFKPGAVGTRTGSVQFEGDARNSPFAVLLTGAGVPVPAPRVTLSASSLGFGNALVGSASTLSLRVTNSGAADLAFGAVEATGSFHADGGCAGVLPAGGACSINVRFIPSMAGILEGRLTLSTNAAGSPHLVALSGTGCRIAFVARSLTLVCSR